MHHRESLAQHLHSGDCIANRGGELPLKSEANCAIRRQRILFRLPDGIFYRLDSSLMVAAKEKDFRGIDENDAT
jgi:hypothetical protein